MTAKQKVAFEGAMSRPESVKFLWMVAAAYERMTHFLGFWANGDVCFENLGLEFRRVVL
jgi:hypothetical protein